MHGRVRRRAGAAGQQQAHVQLDAPEKHRPAARRAAPGKADDERAGRISRLRPRQPSSWRASTAANWRLDDYVARGGYDGAAEDPDRENPAGQRHRRGQEVGAARPRRRGFPDRPEVELHAAAVHAATKYLVCNSDEGEPGTFKDRDILRYNPHIADRRHGDRAPTRWAARAATTTSTARSGTATSAARRPWRRRTQAGYLGDNILGSGFSFHLHNHHGYGAYICGEETALLESLEGKKGQPRFKPPFPASYGLYGKPTTINNTETFAAVPWIINHGGEAFLDLGRPNNGGTKIFSVSGDVERPGNYEVRLGTPFAKLLEMAGGMRGGRQAQGVHSRRLVDAGAARRRHDGHRHGLRLDRQGGLDARLGRGDRHGRDAAAWCDRCCACPISISRNPAASARRAAKAPAGCGAWSTASSTARAKSEDLDLLLSVLGQHCRTHHLRAGRRRGAAGEELHQALPRRVPVPHRPQALPGAGLRLTRPMTTAQPRNRRQAGRGAPTAAR